MQTFVSVKSEVVDTELFLLALQNIRISELKMRPPILVPCVGQRRSSAVRGGSGSPAAAASQFWAQLLSQRVDTGGESGHTVGGESILSFSLSTSVSTRGTDPLQTISQPPVYIHLTDGGRKMCCYCKSTCAETEFNSTLLFAAFYLLDAILAPLK